MNYEDLIARSRSRSSSGTTTIRLRRQITNQDQLVGNPLADAKVQETNAINHVSPGEEGYIPLSHETNSVSNETMTEHDWDDDIIELWNTITKQQQQIDLLKLELHHLKELVPNTNKHNDGTNTKLNT